MEDSKHRSTDWEFGAMLLKGRSTAEIEAAIGKILSELAGTHLQVCIGKIDFGEPGLVKDDAYLTLRVSPPSPF